MVDLSHEKGFMLQFLVTSLQLSNEMPCFWYHFKENLLVFKDIKSKLQIK